MFLLATKTEGAPESLFVLLLAAESLFVFLLAAKTEGVVPESLFVLLLAAESLFVTRTPDPLCAFVASQHRRGSGVVPETLRGPLPVGRLASPGATRPGRRTARALRWAAAPTPLELSLRSLGRLPRALEQRSSSPPEPQRLEHEQVLVQVSSHLLMGNRVWWRSSP